MARNFNAVWDREIAPAMELPFPVEECGTVARDARRRAADLDQDTFNRTYLSTWFTRATTKIHRALDAAMESDGLVCLWAPRGIGKSTRCEAAILRKLLLGQLTYVPYLMKTAEKAQ